MGAGVPPICRDSFSREEFYTSPTTYFKSTRLTKQGLHLDPNMPSAHVVQDLSTAAQTQLRKHVRTIDHADYTAPTRQGSMHHEDQATNLPCNTYYYCNTYY